jgi:hypothetical protein
MEPTVEIVNVQKCTAARIFRARYKISEGLICPKLTYESGQATASNSWQLKMKSNNLNKNEYS